MCLTRWTCGLSASRVGDIMGRTICILKVNTLSKETPGYLLLYLRQHGNEFSAFYLISVWWCQALCRQRCRWAQPSFSRVRQWTAVTSERERAPLCGFQCPCGVGARRQSELIAWALPSAYPRTVCFVTAHKKAIKFEQKESRSWGQKNWVLIVTVSWTDWMIWGKPVSFCTPHYSHLSNGGHTLRSIHLGWENRKNNRHGSTMNISSYD